MLIIAIPFRPAMSIHFNTIIYLLALFRVIRLISAENGAPRCGLVTRVKYTVIDEHLLDRHDPQSTFSINVTFTPIRRKTHRLVPDYYVAVIGNAIPLDEDFSCLYGMSETYGRASNCLQMEEGKCLMNTGHSIIIENLKLGEKYGVVICGIIDASNRQIPNVLGDDKFNSPFRVDRIYEPFYLHERILFHQALLIFSVATIVDFVLIALLMFCCRVWYLRQTLIAKPARK
ncbi:hypothetical protein M3Y98_00022400 [Aphelenchoides besseyi]|nr:hypothetical protein M3Y98_00022400 [Aphelenchoides besseyi]KAI6199264.1 hypothetical protein M3Y96_00608400 [Aphelenchoides besseyi]